MLIMQSDASAASKLFVTSWDWERHYLMLIWILTMASPFLSLNLQ